MIKNIQDVIDNDLCCNCGTCEGICPKNAIRLILDNDRREYKPIINRKKCDNCNTCFLVCPGYSVDFKSLNKYFFNKEPEDLRIGVYSNCYLGNSVDEDVRYNSSSGGVITSILIYALEKGIIDGALVTRMKKDNPFEPEPFIAKNKEEIIEAAKSKYCPVPLNKLITEILKSENLKIAVVGLPCHIHGIRKAEILNKSLKNKIVLHLGLFCSHTDTFWQTYSLINKLDIAESDVLKIDYRGEGWPGKMVIELKNGNIFNLPFQEAMSQHILWINSLCRCLFCCDLTAELSDISFGDPWLPEITQKEKKGKTLIVCRTENANKLLLDSVEETYINLEIISPQKVKKSGAMMESKKKDINGRFLIRRLLNKEIPKYNTELLKPGFKNYMKGFFVYFNTNLSSKPYLRKFSTKLFPLELWVMKKIIGDK
ncbi:Coenzyme F420 hydrogenase/dehydrogenase, beta subunit C-terminal domain [Methanobacterium sp. SMA-27]|uniref:Coenzyme F420 hydrogenase/dehydrogenase, beta subunit C-terminal domain n=1 Tax=Methanobacterium sp. SMA-27 TaxID=1495336 RepID=UPI000693C3DD|nr:Coenzyme F420 hydrogenase/dehydrogenase, beta subunit C-terminal domain [Methanobacterium sp. SMA-27]